MTTADQNMDPMSLGPLSDEGGLSVIELVIACAISLIVLLGLLVALDAGTRAEGGTRSRHEAFRQLHDAVDRASGDIRQATGVSPSSSPTSLDIQTLVAGAPTRVVYAVDGAAFRRTVCTSYDFAAPCGGTAATLAENVSAARAFCYDAECLASAPRQRSASCASRSQASQRPQRTPLSPSRPTSSCAISELQRSPNADIVRPPRRSPGIRCFSCPAGVSDGQVRHRS